MIGIATAEPISEVEVEIGEPIVFRTTSPDVYASSLRTGSLWLRSDRYYRELEDKARKDPHEGFNASQVTIPLRFKLGDSPEITITGEGHLGQLIVPHYLACFHGSSIAPDQRQDFGRHTFGVRSFSRLAVEILFQASQQIRCPGYRYGPVNYGHSALALLSRVHGSAPFRLSSNPPIFLNPLDTDVLRKQPVEPFVNQDEWRIAVFTDGYLEDDPMAPLRINVEPSHFYRYLEPGEDPERGA